MTEFCVLSRAESARHIEHQSRMHGEMLAWSSTGSSAVIGAKYQARREGSKSDLKRMLDVSAQMSACGAPSKPLRP
jgi:hypothetical protein